MKKFILALFGALCLQSSLCVANTITVLPWESPWKYWKEGIAPIHPGGNEGVCWVNIDPSFSGGMLHFKLLPKGETRLLAGFEVLNHFRKPIGSIELQRNAQGEVLPEQIVRVKNAPFLQGTECCFQIRAVFIEDTAKYPHAMVSIGVTSISSSPSAQVVGKFPEAQVFRTYETAPAAGSYTISAKPPQNWAIKPGIPQHLADLLFSTAGHEAAVGNIDLLITSNQYKLRKMGPFILRDTNNELVSTGIVQVNPGGDEGTCLVVFPRILRVPAAGVIYRLFGGMNKQLRGNIFTITVGDNSSGYNADLYDVRIPQTPPVATESITIGVIPEEENGWKIPDRIHEGF